jgi:hypothetical protein
MHGGAENGEKSEKNCAGKGEVDGAKLRGDIDGRKA